MIFLPPLINSGLRNQWENQPDASGNERHFDIQKAEVTLNADGDLQVDIHTVFVNHRGKARAQLGDLFLNSSWNPYGSGPEYNEDDASTSFWGYALAMTGDIDCKPKGKNCDSSGGATLYKMAAENTGALLSDRFFSHTSTNNYRNGQVVRVDTEKNEELKTDGAWEIVDVAGTRYDILRFAINIAGTALADEIADTGKLAIDWAMTCGNDVIAGVAQYPNFSPPGGSVPEPAALALIATGLGGLAWSRRRRHAK
jgi:hypothetical protein